MIYIFISLSIIAAIGSIFKIFLDDYDPNEGCFTNKKKGGGAIQSDTDSWGRC
jgi:hypothetical protein